MDCLGNPNIDDNVQQNEYSGASEFNVEKLLNFPGNYCFFWKGKRFSNGFGLLNL